MYPDKNGYRISTNPSKLDLGVVHGYLKESYWAAGVPEDVVRRSIKNSLCFGVYRDAEQVGARLAAVDARHQGRPRALPELRLRRARVSPDVHGEKGLFLRRLSGGGLRPLLAPP